MRAGDIYFVDVRPEGSCGSAGSPTSRAKLVGSPAPASLCLADTLAGWAWRLALELAGRDRVTGETRGRKCVHGLTCVLQTPVSFPAGENNNTAHLQTCAPPGPTAAGDHMPFLRLRWSCSARQP